MENTRKGNKQKLYYLLAISILPMALSFFMYYFYDYFNFKTTNYGTLVEPAFHSEELTMLGETPKTWQIVYVPAQCSEDKVLHNLHQLRKALGKNSERISLTLVASNQCQNPSAEFRKLVFSAKQLVQFQQAFANNGNAKDKIYLVDPIGNLFMYYPSSTDAMNILKDLRKVLEVSQIG